MDNSKLSTKGLFLRKTWLLDLFLVLFISGVAIYFRTYALHPPVRKISKSAARAVVLKQIEEQFKRDLDIRLPGVSDEARWKLARQQAEETVRLESEKFEETVRHATQKMPAHFIPGRSRHYLLEADPYYYYHLTKQIEKTGRISTVFKGGKFFDPLREAPRGAWAMRTWHPYLGHAWSKWFKAMRPRSDLMEALCYYPLVTVFVAICIFFCFFCRTIKMSRVSAFVASWSMALAPIFVERSSFGWFDTDPYQLIFPFAILGTFFLGMFNTSGRKSIWFMVLSGFLTGLYSLFWAGWFFVPVLLIVSCVLIGFWSFCFKRDTLDGVFHGGTVYLIFTLLCAIFFMTPAGFFEALAHAWNSLLKFGRSESDLWPNAYLTVGEAMPASMRKLAFLVGNPLSIPLIVIGISLSPLSFLVRREGRRFFEWFVLLIFLFALYQIASNTERFAILLVIPIAALTALGAEFVVAVASSLLGFLGGRRMKPPLARHAASLLLLVFLLPSSCMYAYASALTKSTLIMNDTWYGALQEINERTPADSIVNGWWPPGYFVCAIAERKVVIDGGTQHLPETYWTAKALLSGEEQEAAGLLRMMNTSKNEATDFLLKRNFELADAVQLVLRVVSLNRKEAYAILPPSLNGEDRLHFINLTHGTTPHVPAYLFLYNDLMEQNLAVSLMSNWDFAKAKMSTASKRLSPKPLLLSLKDMIKNGASDVQSIHFGISRVAENKTSRLVRENWLNEKGKSESSFGRYLNEVIDINSGIWKYTPESSEIKREGDLVYFANGLQLNLRSKDMVMGSSGESFQQRPISLFYLEQNELKEKIYAGVRVDASALLLERGEKLGVVLANPNLIRSILFRLYYLRGEGCRLFQPFISKEDPTTGTVILVFKIDWEGLENLEPVEASSNG